MCLGGGPTFINPTPPEQVVPPPVPEPPPPPPPPAPTAKAPVVGQDRPRPVAATAGQDGATSGSGSELGIAPKRKRGISALTIERSNSGTLSGLNIPA